jgi:hypothetical protein
MIVAKGDQYWLVLAKKAARHIAMKRIASNIAVDAVTAASFRVFP